MQISKWFNIPYKVSFLSYIITWRLCLRHAAWNLFELDEMQKCLIENQAWPIKIKTRIWKNWSLTQSSVTNMQLQSNHLIASSTQLSMKWRERSKGLQYFTWGGVAENKTVPSAKKSLLRLVSWRTKFTGMKDGRPCLRCSIKDLYVYHPY